MIAPIRTLVADDEALARRMLRALVAKDPELSLVAEARDGPETEELLRKHEPELVLLDVNMPGCDGFSAVSRLPLSKVPVLIFITAHPEHAVRAFDIEAVDYLLKPFDDERFARAIARGKSAVRARQVFDLARAVGDPSAQVQAQPPEWRGVQRLAVKEGRNLVLVEVEQLDWIEAADYYAQLHVGEEQYLLREPLHELELRLDPQRFIRIHRSAIVNLDRVKQLERSEGQYFAVLRDGTRLRISRSRREHLAGLLGAR